MFEHYEQVYSIYIWFCSFLVISILCQTLVEQRDQFTTLVQQFTAPMSSFITQMLQFTRQMRNFISRKPQKQAFGCQSVIHSAPSAGLSWMVVALVLLASAGSDGGRRWDSICPSSASPEIVDLGYENIIKFGQKVALSKIVRGTKPLPKRKICKLRIL